MAQPEIRGVFRRPFDEQIAAFRLRLRDLRDTSRWTDLWQEEHERAFMVAGATKADVLSDIAAAVDRGIAEGTGIDAFARDFRGIVERRGWHGWTGEGSAKGEWWRIRTIYMTNLRTSYMAGRHAQLVEGGFRFWVYQHGGSREPRPQHLAWDGLALPPDHPFWATHFPPNGWGCSCKVFGARTEAGIRRVGGDPAKELADGWDAVDPRTGAPRGIDRGWAYAPGRSVSDTVRAMTAKAVDWRYSLAVAYMREVPPPRRDEFMRSYRSLPSLADALRRYAARATSAGKEPLDDGAAGLEPQRSLGLLTSDQAEEVARLAGVDATLFDFTMDRDAVVHTMRRHGDAEVERSRGQRPVTAADFARLPLILEAPDGVEHTAGDNPEDFVVIYSKVIDGERFSAVFVVRKGRRRLSLKSLWIEVGAGNPRP